MVMPSLAARLIKSTVEVPVILRGISIVLQNKLKMKSEFDSRPRLAARAFINEKFSMHALGHANLSWNAGNKCAIWASREGASSRF